MFCWNCKRDKDNSLFPEGITTIYKRHGRFCFACIDKLKAIAMSDAEKKRIKRSNRMRINAQNNNSNRTENKRISGLLKSLSSNEEVCLQLSQQDQRDHFVKQVRNSLRGILGEYQFYKPRLTIPECESMLGYSSRDITIHIESLWKEGMNWDNRSLWHIDHIRPVADFIKNGIWDIKLINALSNLQPLWAQDNLIKSATYYQI